MSRIVPAGLISAGFQKITTNSIATALNTTCSQGQALFAAGAIVQVQAFKR